MASTRADKLIAEVVEPLCEATKNALRDVRLRDDDYMFLWLNAEGNRFELDLQAYTKRGGKIFSSPWGVSDGARRFLDRIPEKTFLGQHDPSKRFRYEVSCTDFTALVIYHGWPKNRLRFHAPGINVTGWRYQEDVDAKLLFDTLVAEFLSGTINTRLVADFKENGVVPDLPDTWHENENLPLSDYQRTGVALALRNSSYALFFDRGTGKTATSIGYISQFAREHRLAKKGMARVLILCPPQVRMNWAQEFDRFASVPGKVTRLQGPKLKRMSGVQTVIVSEDDCAFSAAITSYDTAAGDIDQLKKIPWDLIVADETQKFKDSSRKRWKVIRELRDSSAHRLGLTGSPIGNSVMDLWTQLEFLEPGGSGFESFKNFRKFYGKWVDLDGAPTGVEKLVATKNAPLLQERLARKTFSITKKEAGLNLPDKVYSLHEVEMTPYQQDIYQQVASRIRVEIEDEISGEMSALAINHIFVKLLRLAQVTSGHVTWDAVIDEETGETLREKRVEEVCRPNPKVQALLQIMDELPEDEKMVVWGVFRKDIELASTGLQASGVKTVLYHGGLNDSQKESSVQAFNNDPETRVIVANPSSAGEGLNLLGYDWDRSEPQLSTYASTVVYYSCNFSALERSQSEDRCHRRGMRGPVQYIDLFVPDTIDQETRDRVQGKIDMANDMLNLKALLRRTLEI